MFVNIREAVKKPRVRMNLARGSSLCMGLFIFVNLNPSTNLNDNLSSCLLRGRLGFDDCFQLSS